MAYYLRLDGADDKVVVPYPVGTKYVQIIVTRKGNDTGGYLLDFRSANDIFCADTASNGYNQFQVDGVLKPVGTTNIADLQNDVKHSVYVGLTSAIATAGNMTIGSRFTTPTPGIDWLTLDLFDVKFLATDKTTILRSFTFGGSGTVLTGSDGVNGTVTGATWLDDGAGGATYSQTVGSATIAPVGSTSLSLALTKTVGGGTVTPTGSLAQNIAGLAITTGGAILQPIGSLVKRTYKGVGGVVTSAGNAAKGMFRTVGNGSISPAGTVSSQLNPEPPPTVLRTAINWVMKGLKNFFD